MKNMDELFDRLPDRIEDGKFDQIYRDADRVWHVVYKNKFGAVCKQTNNVSLSAAVKEMIDYADMLSIKDKTLNKFVISKKNEINSTIGYCLSDLENIDCNLDDLLGVVFKSTSYTRYMGSDGKQKELKVDKQHPEYGISVYNKPSNYINSLSWSAVTMDFLKRMKTFLTVDYNNHKIFIGLDITEDSLDKMSDSKSFVTYYDRGPLSIGGGISHGEFPIE